MATRNVTTYSSLKNGPHELVQFQKANSLDGKPGELHIERLREKDATTGEKRKYQYGKFENKSEKVNKTGLKKGSCLD